MTATPLLGVSEVVRRFLHEKSPDRYVQMMTIEHDDHFSQKEKQRIMVYVHRLKEATPIEHAAAICSWGRDLRWAWPRDGKRETLEGAGIRSPNNIERKASTCSPNMRSSRMAR